MTARNRRVLRDDGHRWVVVVFRLRSLWMRLHVPEERARRPRQKEHARVSQTAEHKTELQFCAGSVRAGQACWGGAAAGASRWAAGRQAIHTAGVSVQEGCECKVLGVCGGS